MADVASVSTDPTLAVPAPDPGTAPSASSVETPASSTPVTADDTVAKVTRIWDALAGDSSSSTPATVPPPARAATAPDGSSAAPKVPATPGPIPFPDHQRVISNTRTRARTDVLGEFGIADAKPDDVKTGVHLVRLLHTDPHLLLRVLQAQLGGASAAGTAPTDPDPEPDGDLDLGNGQFAMSVARQREWMAWQRRQIDGDVKKTYGPLLDAHHQSETTRLGHEMAQGAVGTATKEWPLFDRLRPHIVEQLKALPTNAGVTPAQFFAMYQRVYTTHAPALMREAMDRERAAEVALKTRGSSARPSAAQPVTPHVGKLTTKQRVEQIWNRLETAGAR